MHEEEVEEGRRVVVGDDEEDVVGGIEVDRVFFFLFTAAEDSMMKTVYVFVSYLVLGRSFIATKWRKHGSAGNYWSNLFLKETHNDPFQHARIEKPPNIL